MKEEIKRMLDFFGIWWFMPNGNHFGDRGIPDFVCCCKGSFISIEAKKFDGVWSKLQQDKAKLIEKSLGVYIVVDEYGLGKLFNFLNKSESFAYSNGVYDFRGKSLKENSNGTT